MAALDLRPLSLGEILDRTFTLYRSHFALFLGITAIPQILVLALDFLQLFLGTARPVQNAGPIPSVAAVSANPALFIASILLGILTVVVALIAYLFSQGATVSAVADLYLGRAPAIGASFQKVRGDIGNLFGVVMLNGLVTLVGFLFLVIPGVYLACRLFVALPAAVIEGLGPRDSLERSFALTKDSALRSFLILLLYFVLFLIATALFAWPASFGLIAARGNPGMVRLWTAVSQTLTIVASSLVTPILTIAISALYFDLRVRKEAFDLQVMLHPGAEMGAAGGVPGVLG